MSQVELSEGCPVCKYHQILKRTIDLAFHQMTDRGRVNCRVALQHSVCPHCGFKCLDSAAEATLDEAVRREYSKLPTPPEKSDSRSSRLRLPRERRRCGETEKTPGKT